MVPRIIKDKATEITIAMPLPKKVTKEWKNIEEWQPCYNLESDAEKIISILKNYNVEIVDVRIKWFKYEADFIMKFNSEEDSKSFKNEAAQYLK